MKHIHVACAIIEKERKVLSAQRSRYMSLPLKWEFPGGKIKNGESLTECLRRELQEELGIEAAIGHPLPPVTHSYQTFSVTLHPFICTIIAGEITLHEHAAFAWLNPQELHTLDWAEADVPVIQLYREFLKTHCSV
ncbi:MAG: (deoxy)nucleoside triphosphate pyrophosphohydrolase [Candidatus Brocadia sp.]|nr:(deoxy)nucleoside triphosphate pyrophosphohydrolase [Candidatus Brocadia sp.]